MNVFLTSGGGYTSKGLLSMRKALIETGFNVLTVAPSESCLNSARSISHQHSLSIEQVGGDERHPIYSVDGFPVDCIRFAVLSGLAREVSVVVSGIGEGACLGDEATYSSGLGAAIEAALFGYPSMAISQQSRNGGVGCDEDIEYDFSWSSVLAGELAAWMSACPPPERSILNVNVPEVVHSRHLKMTSFDHRIWDASDFGYVESNTKSGCFTFHMQNDHDPKFGMRSGSDAQAVSTGHVSITPFSLDFEKKSSSLKLCRWTSETIEAINPRIGATSKRCDAGCCG